MGGIEAGLFHACGTVLFAGGGEGACGSVEDTLRNGLENMGMAGGDPLKLPCHLWVIIKMSCPRSRKSHRINSIRWKERRKGSRESLGLEYLSSVLCSSFLYPGHCGYPLP